MELQRVAVTGVGTVCGLGLNTETVWKNLCAGTSGISKIQNPEPSERWPVTIAGEVKDFQLDEEILPLKEQSRYDRFIHFAMKASDEALKNCGFEAGLYPAERIGAILGVGMGGFPCIEEGHETFLNRGPRRVSPFFIPKIIPNMASGKISIRYGVRGSNFTISSACASSGHALSTAASEIMLGRQDMVISGGCEAVVSALTISGFNAMKALSKREDEPQKASRPFDKDRDGFVMGEGAGVLILENFEKAKSRGAKILAELVGFGATSDAHHITAPHPEGEGAIACMKQSLDMVGIDPKAIGYINAHGTSTPIGDIAETKAIKNLFGAHAYELNVSSTKSMTGHLLGAAGGIESVFCVKALFEKEIPPTINLDNPDAECDLNYTAHQSEKKEVEYALNNSFGFGGTNSSLIFKRV